MTTADEKANLRNVGDWERERILRADAYAAALTHLNAAAQALADRGENAAARLANEIAFHADAARGNLRRVLDESNPFVA